ncbi:hypothetical protein [Megamonas funiformis]|uniref:hypothetical protein n=1 Tax=Megamonas funiformis TaxID=437897 RepID=UPI003567F0B5
MTTNPKTLKKMNEQIIFCATNSTKLILQALNTSFTGLSEQAIKEHLDILPLPLGMGSMSSTSKISFIQSNASKPVLITTIIGIILFTGLTFTPFATNLGLTQLPALYFIYLFVIVILYMLLISFAKYSYIAKYKKLI